MHEENEQVMCIYI